MSMPHDARPDVQMGVSASDAQMALVLIHGRGAPAPTMIPLAEALLDGVDAAVTVRLPSADGDVWYPDRFTAPTARNQPFLDGALARIERVLDGLIAEGIAPERIVLGGFSQGACLTLETFARRGQRLGAVIAYAGGLIGPTVDRSRYQGTLGGTPAYLGCGDPDPHIPIDRVFESADVLKDLGASVDVQAYRGLPHTVSMEQVEIGRSLVRNVASSAGSTAHEAREDEDPSTWSDATWRDHLGDAAYRVLRHEATERPGSSPLNHEWREGTYVCAGCGHPLFRSTVKFDAHCGWPSFYDALPGAFETKVDHHLIYPRTEYHCARCGGHHGHVFEDGPAPTGLRYCSNGVALRFVPDATAGSGDGV